MRIDAIEIGHKPPEDINVIIEVPLGGQPIKYELDKDAGVDAGWDVLGGVQK